MLIGDGGWSGYEIMAPGDTTGNGHVDLLARRTATGEFYLHTGTGPQGEGLASGDRTQIGTGWTTTAHPLVTSVPDVLGDGKRSVWAANSAGSLLFYPNIQGGGNAVGSGLTGFHALN
ncbi:hypothetical protein ACFY9H_10330 [Streptomyces bacillaris]|uniref:FG-GAP repeat protein n=1 Tax=Streptomyces cavourensis TaxID=67258 RepID=A0ABY5FFP0_9ACTN|nr:hypothetical protein [Streptomyces cavourensis]UTR82374.1 hypothetical protein NLU04_29850 [Streptomyces cavourensis]